MEAFNAEANVRAQREAAYADRYVTLKPKGALKGLRLENGGELHHDDGSIVRLLPGDWVVELPDGRLTGIAAATFIDSFEIRGVSDKEDQLKATRIQAGLSKAPTPEPTVEEPRPEAETVKEQVLRAHEEMNERVAMWANAAFDEGLISEEEKGAMLRSNEFPEGLTVKEENGEWLLSRGEGNDVGSLGLRDKSEDEDEIEWRDRTSADIRSELTRRHVEHKTTAKKAELLELIEASDANIAMGGDGTLAVEPLPEPIVSVGAETPDTAAKDPKAPDHGLEQIEGQTTFVPEDASEHGGESEDDGRRPGGETRTEEDGEVKGPKEEAQEAASAASGEKDAR